ncbi:MAG: YwmB family TATA-box binding protein [Clostridia bacterium]|nr:YwmB family TATA-box binding protein [Clostridia bacterium]
MKRLLLFSLTFILIALPNTSTSAFISLSNYKPDATYSFYVAGEVPFRQNYYVVDNAGLGSIIRCDANFSVRVKKNLQDIIGESISFEGYIREVFSLLKYYKATIVKVENLEPAIYSVYASSNYFKNSIEIDEKRVNLQIVYNAGRVTLGTPIILGDY